MFTSTIVYKMSFDMEGTVFTSFIVFVSVFANFPYFVPL